MPKMDIDEIAKTVCEPIEVIVGGKAYTVVDIPLETTKKMAALDAKSSDPATSVDALIEVMAEILEADIKDIEGLGSRKLFLLVKNLMGVLNTEAEAKNVPEVEVTKSPK